MLPLTTKSHQHVTGSLSSNYLWFLFLEALTFSCSQRSMRKARRSFTSTWTLIKSQQYFQSYLLLQFLTNISWNDCLKLACVCVFVIRNRTGVTKHMSEFLRKWQTLRWSRNFSPCKNVNVIDVTYFGHRQTSQTTNPPFRRMELCPSFGGKESRSIYSVGPLEVDILYRGYFIHFPSRLTVHTIFRRTDVSM
jgi:hypothetical protein